MKKTLILSATSSWLVLTSCFIAAPNSEAAQSNGRGKSSYTPTPPSYAASASASHSDGRPQRSLESRVTDLARNDHHQDVRLSHLERDVSSLKPGVRTVQLTSTRSTATSAPTKLHTVRAGETLWRIAARYNTSINALRLANRMTGDTVGVGQTLVIPTDDAPVAASQSPAVHVVVAGDTFSGLAHRYNVTQDALAKANPTVYPDRVLVGERLTIPGRKAVAVPEYTPQPSTKERAKENALTVHTVQPGESLGAIAKKHGIPTATLAAANKLKNPNLVEVGQKLTIPAATSAPAISPRPRAAESQLVKHRMAPATDDTVPLPEYNLPAKVTAETPVSRPEPKLPAPMQTETVPAPSPAVKSPSPMPTGAHRGVVAYRLEKGDDLSIVANMFSTTPAKIRELNMLSATAELKEGDEVVVPALSPLSAN